MRAGLSAPLLSPPLLSPPLLASPAQAGAQSRNVDPHAQRAITSTFAPGPRPSPGKEKEEERGKAEEWVIAAARGAIGVRFRVQGRDPAFGLDCVGLAALAARAGGFTGEIPGDYALRGGDAATLVARFAASGLVRCDPAPGAIALFATGPAQFHLAVLVPGGLVHADALLRRVVERPGEAPWPRLGCWRVTGD